MLIAAARIITASRTASGAHAVLAPGYVRCVDGRIASVGAGSPPGKPDLQLHDGVLVPGFVDLQVNGYFGVELAAADLADWQTVARRLAETGTTAFMPTFVTSPLDDMADALRRGAEFHAKLADGSRGARVLGVHAEGPFISPSRPGAHNLDWIVDPDPAAVGSLLTA